LTIGCWSGKPRELSYCFYMGVQKISVLEKSGLSNPAELYAIVKLHQK